MAKRKYHGGLPAIDTSKRKPPTRRKYQPDAKGGTVHFSVTLSKALVAQINKRAKAAGESRSLTVQKALMRDFSDAHGKLIS